MPQLRQSISTVSVVLTCAVVVATVWVLTLDDAARDVTSFSENQVPYPGMLGMVVTTLVVPLGIVALSHENPRAVVGLTMAGCAALLPLWAAWPDLDARWRVLALTAGILTSAGLALMSRSWSGAALAGASAVLHALAYDPFRDVGCAFVCREVAPVLTVPTPRLTLVVAVGLSLSAAFAVGGALRFRGTAIPAAAGAVAVAVLAVVRWRTTGDPDAHALLLLALVPIPGLVALPGVVAWARVVRRRVAVRRLALHLAEDPEGLLEIGAAIDSSLLSPGQRLAVHNAQLAAEARARVVEVRESQRRVVAAADAERRRIERDLHDGAQQRLVGVLMQLSGRGLPTVEREIRAVLAHLRTFGHNGTFPPVLEEEGLEAALVELAATTDAALALDIRLNGPVSPEHARAVYALVAQASAGVVEVTLASLDDGIRVTVLGMTEVELDGVRDRFGALGGTLVASGRSVEGSLPCGW